MKAHLVQFWQEDKGQDMVEYTLLLSFIVVTAIAVLGSARAQMVSAWSTINTAYGNAVHNAVS